MTQRRLSGFDFWLTYQEAQSKALEMTPEQIVARIKDIDRQLDQLNEKYFAGRTIVSLTHGGQN